MLFWPTVRQNCSSVKNLLKFEAEGQEFAKITEKRFLQYCYMPLQYLGASLKPVSAC